MSNFDSIVRVMKVFGYQLAQTHSDVQSYDPKKVTMVHIRSDRKFLDQYSNDLKEHVLRLGEVATEDRQIKEASVLIIKHFKFIYDSSLKLDALEEYLNTPSKVPTPPKISIPQVKLPNLDLPTFDGKHESWILFKEYFTAAIVTNSVLSDSERLEYLYTAVNGATERLLKSFPICDSNFDDAWALLCKRYDNNRELVLTILKFFLSQLTLHSETLPSLRKLVDVSLQWQQYIAVLKRPVDLWDDMLVCTIVDKLDDNTKREWAKCHTGSDMPTFAKLVDFLELYISASRSSLHSGGDVTRASHHSSSKSKCPCCDRAHTLYSCSSFRALSPLERVSVVKSKHLCYNCLSPNHGVSSCKSISVCRVCHKPHNTLLHFESTGGGHSNASPAASNTFGIQYPPPVSTEADNPQSSTDQSSFLSSSSINVANHYSKVNGILPPTAEVEAQDSSGYFSPCRVSLDTGLESSFITDKCETRLGRKKKEYDMKITSYSFSSVERAASTISCNVRLRVNNFVLKMNASVLPKVTGYLPSLSTGGAQTWAHLKDLEWFVKGPVGMQQMHATSSSLILICAHSSTTKELGNHQPAPPKQFRENVGATKYSSHHWVIKDDSSITKLLVVNENSLSTTSGSLDNYNLCVSPTIKEDLFSHFYSFRFNLATLQPNIVKMIRKLLVPPDDQHQQALWSESHDHATKEYRPSPETCGIASAPFTSTKSFQHVLEDKGYQFPQANNVAASELSYIRKSFIVRVEPECLLLNIFPCFSTLNRVTAHNLRFMYNCRARNKTSRPCKVLSIQELQSSSRCLIGLSQQDFQPEISVLSLGRWILASSKFHASQSFANIWNGQHTTVPPEPEHPPSKVNRLSLWETRQRASQHLWQLWHPILLREQTKDKLQFPILKIKDFVLHMDENCGPFRLKLGRILTTHPSPEYLIPDPTSSLSFQCSSSKELEIGTPQPFLDPFFLSGRKSIGFG
ncbi:unnamed protein product [Orchesella dallaii]|uniref:Uncharacterized protein n=1 Tax=Orchesella dallaii TaxID=48710 RepID=A0ABP1QR34_9HEXA